MLIGHASTRPLASFFKNDVYDVRAAGYYANRLEKHGRFAYGLESLF